jgi:hypothetical protein
MKLPFEEIKSEDSYIRKFSKNTEDSELVWHRDREDRIIKVVKSGGWFFQYEDQLPFRLKEGSEIKVLKGEYHRVIKGYGDLELSIKKINRDKRSLRSEHFVNILKTYRP